MTDITLAQFMCDFHKDTQEIVVNANWLQEQIMEKEAAIYELKQAKEKMSKLKDKIIHQEAAMEYLKDIGSTNLRLIV